MGKRINSIDLGRRERQIMDVIFQLGEASVGEVFRRLPVPCLGLPAHLRNLCDHGRDQHQQAEP